MAVCDPELWAAAGVGVSDWSRSLQVQGRCREPWEAFWSPTDGSLWDQTQTLPHCTQRAFCCHWQILSLMINLREWLICPLLTHAFCMLCSRWCCWHAARATAATRPVLTPSSPSAPSSNSPSRAPAPAAGRTPPSWRRWGCAAPAGLASRPLTDTS